MAASRTRTDLSPACVTKLLAPQRRGANEPERPASDGADSEAVASPADHLGFALSGSKRLTVGVTDDIAACDLVGAPGRGETTGYQASIPPPYGFHLTGGTASGVPLLELIQPDAVRLHGLGSL
jgi:hypothetical protein